MISTKERLLTAINTALPLKDYKREHYIFSSEYFISATDMIYILKQLSADFKFTITDDFVDALENCTFARLEELLEQYSNTAA